MRPISRKSLLRFFFYLAPALVDMIVGAAFFMNPVRATILGSSYTIVGTLVMIQACAYMIVSFTIARFVSPRNASLFMIISSISLLAATSYGLFINSLTELFISAISIGLASGFFFSPALVFMKTIDTAEKGRTLQRSGGLFVFSWSMGIASGPLLCGFLMRMSTSEGTGGEKIINWLYPHLMEGGISILLIAITVWMHFSTKDLTSSLPVSVKAPETPKISPVRQRPTVPDLAWLGWIMGFAGATSIGTFRNVFVSAATRLDMPENLVGLISALLSFVQGISALCLSLTGPWMYSGLAMLGLGLTGTGGLLSFAIPGLMEWHGSVIWFFIGAIAFGLYNGSVYLYASFHALAHPQNAARNASFNEGIVNAGNMTGPLIGGLLAENFGFGVPFAFVAALVLVLGIIQFFLHRAFPLRR